MYNLTKIICLLFLLFQTGSCEPKIKEVLVSNSSIPEDLSERVIRYELAKLAGDDVTPYFHPSYKEDAEKILSLHKKMGLPSNEEKLPIKFQRKYEYEEVILEYAHGAEMWFRGEKMLLIFYSVSSEKKTGAKFKVQDRSLWHLHKGTWRQVPRILWSLKIQEHEVPK